MASSKRVHCWLFLLVFLCLVGCMVAIRMTPSSALLLEPRLDYANGKGAFIDGVGESQSALKEDGDMDEVARILLASGNEMVSSTMDYSPPGSNKDHDPKNGGGHHPHGSGSGIGNGD